MDIKEKKYKWCELYSYVIPTILVILYGMYIILIFQGKINAKLIQESKYFGDMLETLVTFMSIILSVFGFLIPLFLSEKGKSETVNYFIKYADMKLFAAKLKNIVANGLIEVFVTSILLLNDIISGILLNLVILIWLWGLFFFMCNSYRFISLMINMLLTEKTKFTQNMVNKATEEEIKQIHTNIRNI